MTIPREMLYLADEIFFTGTAAEVTPVRSVDRMPVGSGMRGPVTKAVQDVFFGIVRGEREDKWGWLTPVAMGEAVAA
jgi:branched-chain amino acid aminotransferase